jgi:hypothetical protein
MRKLVGFFTLVLMAVLAATPASAGSKGKKISKAQLQNIDWGRRSDVKSQFWPLHLYPSVKIY